MGAGFARRHARALATALVLAAVAAIVAGGVWLHGTTPLQAGSTGGAYPERGQTSSIDGQSEWKIPFRNGGEFQWMVSIANSGRFAVRIDGTDSPVPHSNGLYHVVGLRLLTNPNNYSWTATKPFHPVEVQPGDEVTLVVRMRMGDCRDYPSGGSQSSDSFAVRYTQFGIWHRRQDVTVPGISVAAPRVCHPG